MVDESILYKARIIPKKGMVHYIQCTVVVYLVETQQWFSPIIRNRVWNPWPMKCNCPSITCSHICGVRHLSMTISVLPWEAGSATCWLGWRFLWRQDVTKEMYCIFQVKEPMTPCPTKTYSGSILSLLHFGQQVCISRPLACFKCHKMWFPRCCSFFIIF